MQNAPKIIEFRNVAWAFPNDEVLCFYKIKKKELESHFVEWTEIVQKNGGYNNPLYLEIWITKGGEITDSMSFRGLTANIIRDTETDDDLWNPYNAYGLHKEEIYDYLSRESIMSRT